MSTSIAAKQSDEGWVKMYQAEYTIWVGDFHFTLYYGTMGWWVLYSRTTAIKLHTKFRGKRDDTGISHELAKKEANKRILAALEDYRAQLDKTIKEFRKFSSKSPNKTQS